MPLQIENTEYDEIYPPAFPVMALNRKSSAGTYPMTSKMDFSGKGKNLETNAEFNSDGLVCVKSGGSAQTNIAESELITIVVALNIPARPSASANIISSLTPATAPFSGFRITQQADGTGNVLVSTGISSPSNTTLSLGTITGGWTMFAVSISNEKIVGMRSNGNPIEVSITNGRSIGKNSIVINGAPQGSQLMDGIDGIIGGIAFYNEQLSAPDMLSEINNMRQFMSTKGVVIP